MMVLVEKSELLELLDAVVDAVGVGVVEEGILPVRYVRRWMCDESLLWVFNW